MIFFNGIFQLVKVHKESKTQKGDTIVYFTGASQRAEDKTDFKFFKMIGQKADFFLRNLQKNNDGKYISRKMFISGYIETYNENQEVECTASLKKDKIPEQAGYLKVDLKIKAKTQVQIQRDTLMVQNFEFVDKKKDQEVSVMIDDEIEIINDSPIIMNTSNTNNSKSKASSVTRDLDDAMNNLSNFSVISDFLSED